MTTRPVVATDRDRLSAAARSQVGQLEDFLRQQTYFNGDLVRARQDYIARVSREVISEAVPLINDRKPRDEYRTFLDQLVGNALDGYATWLSAVARGCVTDGRIPPAVQAGIEALVSVIARGRYAAAVSVPQATDLQRGAYSRLASTLPAHGRSGVITLYAHVHRGCALLVRGAGVGYATSFLRPDPATAPLEFAVDVTDTDWYFISEVNGQHRIQRIPHHEQLSIGEMLDAIASDSGFDEPPIQRLLAAGCCCAMLGIADD